MALSRRFAAWVTALKADPFRVARIRLTAFYLLIITVIVVVLSSALYSVHSTNVHRFQEHAAEPAEDLLARRTMRQSLTDYLEDLGRSIILADIITIVVAGGLSYVLAGRTLAPIRANMEAEKQLFAAVAHDLKTPLAVMKTEAEVALRGKRTTVRESKDVLASTIEEVDRMSSLVDQILALSRLRSAGSFAARSGSEQSVVNFTEVAERAVKRHQLHAINRHITLTFERTADAAWVTGNRSDLERAIANIVDNAIRYNRPGGSVAVSLERRGSHIDLSVQDTGAGIPGQHLSRITEPFYRVDSSRTEDSGGAGLGLSIARQIAENRGGSLLVSSTEGEGTHVTLRLPTHKPPHSAEKPA